jgi:4-methyl-5(b-hydroxyethyl)-thiazole monophosphate biosynthesis
MILWYNKEAIKSNTRRNTMIKKAVVLLAEGYEEVEAVTPVDYLCRAGIEVTSASITENLTVTSRWGKIKLIADTTLAEVLKQGYQWDAVIIPGGLDGATNLAASKEACAFIKEMAAAGKLICAICSSPVIVLASLDLLAGKKFTCFPEMEKEVQGGIWSEDRVVVDGNIITSRGAGTAGEWSIAIIGKLLDENAGRKTAESVLL